MAKCNIVQYGIYFQHFRNSFNLLKNVSKTHKMVYQCFSNIHTSLLQMLQIAKIAFWHNILQYFTVLKYEYCTYIYLQYYTFNVVECKHQCMHASFATELHIYAMAMKSVHCIPTSNLFCQPVQMQTFSGFESISKNIVDFFNRYKYLRSSILKSICKF